MLNPVLTVNLNIFNAIIIVLIVSGIDVESFYVFFYKYINKRVFNVGLFFLSLKFIHVVHFSFT